MRGASAQISYLSDVILRMAQASEGPHENHEPEMQSTVSTALHVNLGILVRLIKAAHSR